MEEVIVNEHAEDNLDQIVPNFHNDEGYHVQEYPMTESDSDGHLTSEVELNDIESESDEEIDIEFVSEMSELETHDNLDPMDASDDHQVPD